jgi:hypothetical protein
MSHSNLVPDAQGTQRLDKNVGSGQRDQGKLTVKTCVFLFFCLMSATMLAWLFLLGWILRWFFF